MENRENCECKETQAGANSSVKERLLEFIKAKRIRQADVTRALGVSTAYITSMRKSLPEEKVVILCREFPDLNRDWLLYGEGEMLLRPGAGSGEGSATESIGSEVPLLPVSAFAGRLQDWSEPVMRRQCEMIKVPVTGVDFAIQISGDSMEPAFHDGTTLLIRRINERAFIPWGQPMVIDSENGVLVKALYPIGNGEEFVEARSYNAAYPPIKLPTASIFGLYRVVGAMRMYTTL